MAFPEIKGYEILSRLGEGGMGTVYLAREQSTGGHVALKLLRSALSTDSEFVLRFKREAKALSSLSHPGIARYMGSGADGGFIYFAMEYVEGEPLSKRLADGPLPVGQACSTAAEVAEALAAAHAAGIIHRDVKPSNIILSPSGAKLTDFGLARRVEGTRLTTSGRVMGSLSYMSPEQVMGEKLTGASDVYSLGAVLFEMLAGTPPFEAGHDEALAAKVLTQPTPLVSRRRRDAPVGLDLLLIKMLAKDTRLRPSSAADAAEMLREIAGGKPVKMPGAGAGGKHDGLLRRAGAALGRAAIGVLPAGKTGNRLAASIGRSAGRLVPTGSPAAVRIEAAFARRDVRNASRELEVLARKRLDRLKAAQQAEASARSADVEERQSRERLAREMRLEAEVFERRIAELAETVAACEKRANMLEEKARASAGAG